jgi:ubiquinone/menaquinone biosynthesis C-methylase UbiE/DNA-binding transcriptional ArsR family regulator
MMKALGNPVRFQIVQILAEKQTCITGEIVEFTTLAQSTVSQHLKVLQEAGLIHGEVEGPATCYCLDEENIRWLKDEVDSWLPQCCAGISSGPLPVSIPSRDYFERNAARWDNLRASYFSDALRDAAMRRAYLSPDMTVADVGGGTGFLSAGLAPRVQAVHLLDASPAMLDQAREALAGFSNVVYHLVESDRLPLPDASVDAVLTNMYLHHMPDPAVAVREMARILRPGGRLVITDMDRHDHAWMREEMADLWLGFNRSDLHAWLVDAGLVNVYVEESGESCCAASEAPQLRAPDGQAARITVLAAVGTRPVEGVESAVRSGYGAIAEGTSTSCCSPGEACTPPGYSQSDLRSVPDSASEIALGCGNPTAFARLNPGQVVLDIGSGGGLDCFLAAQKVGSTGRVIGVDMTLSMVQRAREAAAQAGIPNVEFHHAQADALPVSESSVDVVLSNCVINLTPDKGRVFAEAARVLKPGGRLEVSDIVTGGSLPLQLRADPQQWAGCVFGALPEAEYLALIRQSGFGAVVVRRSVYGQVEGIEMASLTVSAVKGEAWNAPVYRFNRTIPARPSGCCD